MSVLGTPSDIPTIRHPVGFNNLIEHGTQRAVQMNEEDNTSAIYQMPEINPDIAHSALFLTSKAARH